LSRKAFFLPFIALCAAAWVAGCAQTPPPGLARGKVLFTNCVPCHGERGLGNPSLDAPEIAGLPRWYIERQLIDFQTSMRGAHPQDSTGARMRPMARALYRPGDVASVAEFVATLKPSVPVWVGMHGDTAAGRTRYQSVCIACHQEDGSGNEALGAPPLTRQFDWYMLGQIEKFKSGMRGAHPEDPMGAQMAAMSQTLEDSTAMHDVIAYIRTLQKESVNGR
jgi:cytochrome c oxidase subunit 2